MRPLLSNHARYAAAVMSYVRQNSGHQLGTPGLEMTAAWVRSKMPCAASATTTTQSPSETYYCGREENHANQRLKNECMCRSAHDSK
jgi:hypothetical protein